MRRTSIGIGVLVLLVATALQLRQRHGVESGRGRHLAMELPVVPIGWQGRDVPLGATEFVEGEVEKALRFDDVYFREFESPRGTVSLYVAYWGPGKMPVQLVASHTPDRCWSSAGWICDQLRHEDPLDAGRLKLRPGEWRLFRAPAGGKLQVQYWHLVGTGLYDYGQRFNRVPSVWRWWRDAAKQVFAAPPEQYFIRLTSDRPFEELMGDPGWEELLAALAKLGLARESGE